MREGDNANVIYRLEKFYIFYSSHRTSSIHIFSEAQCGRRVVIA